MKALAERTGAHKRVPGRPRRNERAAADVASRIAAATESLLKQHTHHDLTEQQIADAANVDKKMIYYYFDSKNGLIFELLSGYADEVYAALGKLCELDPADELITRRFFEILIDAYLAKPWFVRAMASEYPRADSVIMKRYFQRHGALGVGTVCIQRALDRLVALGAFSKDCDTHLTALTITSLFGASYLRFSLLSNFGAGTVINPVRRQEWIDFLAHLYGRQWQAPGK